MSKLLMELGNMHSNIMAPTFSFSWLFKPYIKLIMYKHMSPLLNIITPQYKVPWPSKCSMKLYALLRGPFSINLKILYKQNKKFALKSTRVYNRRLTSSQQKKQPSSRTIGQRILQRKKNHSATTNKGKEQYKNVKKKKLKKNSKHT